MTDSEAQATGSTARTSTTSTTRPRPLVSPEIFSGESNWTDWVDHFETVATVNGWDDATKLTWLPVRLTGKAQVAWKRLAADAKEDYDTAKESLRKRFEPDSKRQLYAAEFHSRRRRSGEQWGDFADQLRCLADRAFPTLEEDAKELLTLDRYLGNINDPKIAFAVRQQRPKTVEEAVASTLEMESYAAPEQKQAESKVSLVDEESEYDLCMIRSQQGVVPLLESIVSRLEKLESNVGDKDSRRGRWRRSDGSSPRRERLSQEHAEQQVKCFKCGKEGHYARGCASRSSKPQEN